MCVCVRQHDVECVSLTVCVLICTCPRCPLRCTCADSLDGGEAGRRSSWMKLRRCLYSSLLFSQVELLDVVWQIGTRCG